MDPELLALDRLTVERRTCSRCGYACDLDRETGVMVPDRAAWARVCINVDWKPLKVPCAAPQRCGASLNSVSAVMRLSRWAIIKAQAPSGFDG